MTGISDLFEALGPLGDIVVGRTNEGRDAIRNPDGSLSTERSITVMNPLLNRGGITNIPSIFAGKQMDEDAAVNLILELGRIPGSVPAAGMAVDPVTGRRLPSFPTMADAIEAAKARSAGIDIKLFGPRR